MTLPTIASLRRAALHEHFKQRDIDSLLRHALGYTTAQLYASPEQVVGATQLTQFQCQLNELGGGRPLEHLVGHGNFLALQLELNPDVLIPRPATECLVEATCNLIEKPVRVLELGTGSGAIAVALMVKAAHIQQLIASDVSHRALAVARRNLATHLNDEQVTRVHLVRGFWFEPFDPTPAFDLIVSNPPYVKHNDPELQASVARYEPHLALFAEERGLACLRTIIAQAPRYLRAQGRLIVEHGADQAPEVMHMMHEAGFNGQTLADHEGLPRIGIGQLA